MDYTQEVIIQTREVYKGARNRHTREEKTNWDFRLRVSLFLLLDQRKHYLNPRWKFGFLNLWLKSSSSHDSSHIVLWFESLVMYDSNQSWQSQNLTFKESCDSSQVHFVIRIK